MADKNITLKDANDNNLYPITQMGNVNGLSSYITNALSNYVLNTSSSLCDFTTTTQLYNSTSISTGSKTITSMADYKILIFAIYNSNSTGWTYCMIPKTTFTSLNTSSSNYLWIAHGSVNTSRRFACYYSSNTSIYFGNVDGTGGVRIWGIK